MADRNPKIELVDLRLCYESRSEADPIANASSLAVDLRGTEATPAVAIFPGEITVLLGPSGCGKSSLLRIIAGLVDPTEGQVLKDGKPIRGPGRDRVMVFQSYTSFPWLTVEQNVSFALDLQKPIGKESWKEYKRHKEKKVREIIDIVGLSDSLRKYPRELSGGMRQRVAIARALVCSPDVLLMDEPFGALDPHIRVKMQELLLCVERNLMSTIIFVTHDAREAVFLGDVIYISTLRPCFLKYRIVHPFAKSEIQREKARERYPADFLRFQRDVEDRMQFLIDHPEAKRVTEKDDHSSFQRSTLGMLEQLSSEMGSG